MKSIFHTLLLTHDYLYLDFLPFRRMIKLYVKDKIEILNEWDERIIWDSEMIKYPATVKLKNPIPRYFHENKFSRLRIFRRDHYLCQYCGEALTSSNVSMDHVFPKDRGGIDSWENCVTSCIPCNNSKGNKTPEEAGMKLKKIPTKPTINHCSNEYYALENKHPEWKDYLGIKD